MGKYTAFLSKKAQKQLDKLIDKVAGIIRCDRQVAQTVKIPFGFYKNDTEIKWFA